MLTTHLEASLLDDDAPAPDLAAAIAEHRTLPRPDDEAAPPGDPDRAPELARRPGWAWMRVVRRYDDYERALELLEQERRRIGERVGASG